MSALTITERSDRPSDDPIVVFRDATWADFQRMLKMRGEHSAPRLAFLDGTLQLMSPSKNHELLKSFIGRLVEVWCLEHNVEFSPYGGWTLQSKPKRAGVEPDECYVFGDHPDATRPDLAIEVVWTSGGIDKLAIYQRLGVREVWFWQHGTLTPYRLVGDGYVEATSSDVLPGLDLALLVTFLDLPTASAAIRAWRKAITHSG